MNPPPSERAWAHLQRVCGSTTTTAAVLTPICIFIGTKLIISHSFLIPRDVQEKWLRSFLCSPAKLLLGADGALSDAPEANIHYRQSSLSVLLPRAWTWFPFHLFIYLLIYLFIYMIFLWLFMDPVQCAWHNFSLGLPLRLWRRSKVLPRESWFGLGDQTVAKVLAWRWCHGAMLPHS